MRRLSPDGLSLVQVDIDAAGHITATGFGGANDAIFGDYSGVSITLSVVPEPSTMVAGVFAVGMGTVCLMRSCRRGTPAA